MLSTPHYLARHKQPLYTTNMSSLLPSDLSRDFGVRHRDSPEYFDETYGEDFNLNDLQADLASDRFKGDGEGWSELDISGSGIRTLSPEIRNFNHLTSLFLNNNKIQKLPEDIFTQLNSLVCLDLSYNFITRLPSSFKGLMQLQRLYLTENMLTELPSEMGRFYRIKELSVLGNPLMHPPNHILAQGTDTILLWLRDRISPGAPPPDRQLLQLLDANGNSTTPIGQQLNNSTTISYEKDLRLRVITYNILADSYATTEQYGYCPTWALEWSYRSQRIKKELLLHDPDIICLQEVEAGAFNNFFQVELGKNGYFGVFTPKSRARTMDNWINVDGCAIFYKSAKFNHVEEISVEFQRVAMSKHKEFSEDQEAFTRLITKDNIALILVLQILEDPPLNVKGPKFIPKPKYVLVATTHIFWNQEFRDVKLLQVQFLMEQISSMTSIKTKWNRIPMIICGDFNAVPGSGPYEFMMSGRIPPRHEDLEPYYYGDYSENGMRHPFLLSSAYAAIGEPQFTNYTGDFSGALDYIFYSSDTLGVNKILAPVEEEAVRESRLPNAFMNSDHIPIMAEFLIKKR